MAKSCRTCRYWAIPPGSRAMRHAVYECTVPVPDLKSVLPESAIKGLHLYFTEMRKAYMGRDDGTECCGHQPKV